MDVEALQNEALDAYWDFLIANFDNHTAQVAYDKASRAIEIAVEEAVKLSA